MLNLQDQKLCIRMKDSHPEVETTISVCMARQKLLTKVISRTYEKR